MGRTSILVVRSDDRFSSLLRESGCEVLNLELIRTEVLNDLGDLENAISHLAQYDGLFFTSPVSAGAFIEKIDRIRNFAGKIYVLGERTRKLFEDAGVKPTYAHGANTAEDLIAGVGPDEFLGKKLLFVRGDKSMRAIPELLSGKAIVDEIVVYTTLTTPPDENVRAEAAKRLKKGEIGWICFFSPSGVEAFAEIFAEGEFTQSKIAAIGKTTAGKAEALGFNVEFVSPHATSEDFAKGLLGLIEEH
jgi:uroporphyrinogen-III synthase